MPQNNRNYGTLENVPSCISEETRSMIQRENSNVSSCWVELLMVLLLLILLLIGIITGQYISFAKSKGKLTEMKI